MKWARLSCHDFRDNQVRLQLFALAYNLGNFPRRLALPAGVEHWSLTTLRKKLVKIGAKLVRHARYVVPLCGMAELRHLEDRYPSSLAEPTKTISPVCWATTTMSLLATMQ